MKLDFSQRYKIWALEVLKGKWTNAVLFCLLSELLFIGVGMLAPVGTEGKIQWVPLIFTWIFTLLISAVVSVGTSHYFTKLASNRPAQIADLFAYFRYFGKVVWVRIVVLCYVMLWSLLFLIPGIIAAYRYAMVPYLIAEFPDLTVEEAMEESTRLMNGRKMELFWLHLSFIGWIFLAAIMGGIGMLWVMPYMYTAEAAFYLDVTGRSGLRFEEPQQ